MTDPRAFTLPPGGGSAITLPVATGSKPDSGTIRAGSCSARAAFRTRFRTSATDWATRPEADYGSTCA
jgi:hypothetical protein